MNDTSLKVFAIGPQNRTKIQMLKNKFAGVFVVADDGDDGDNVKTELFLPLTRNEIEKFDLKNPPSIMQHLARREREREQD